LNEPAGVSSYLSVVLLDAQFLSDANQNTTKSVGLCCTRSVTDKQNESVRFGEKDNSRINNNNGRSQWPRGLRHGSAAARLLGLRVRISSGEGVFVANVVCCKVEGSASG